MSIATKEYMPTRSAFERNLQLLREALECGEVQISNTNTQTIAGFKKARILTNGRINLVTINESLRLTANTSVSMQYYTQKENKRNETKK